MHFSGLLLKWTNYFSGWQERWFVLDNGILSYYKSQDDVSNGCKGSVKMSVCDIVVHHTDNTRLDLIIPGEQHFYIKALNAKERQQWLVAMGTTKASTGKANEDKETEMHDLLKSKRSELRLYCDLLMQQIHSVKMAVKEDAVPDIESLNQATSLLSPTCDTFIHTLDECMKIIQASVPLVGPLSPITDATVPQSPHKHQSKKNRQFNRQNSVDRTLGPQRSRSSSVNSNDTQTPSRQNSRQRTGSEASGSDLSLTEHSILEHSPVTSTQSSAYTQGRVQSMNKDSQSSNLRKYNETGSVNISKHSDNVNNSSGTSLSSRERVCMTGTEQNGVGSGGAVSDDGEIFLDPIESRLPTFFSEMNPSFADLKFTSDGGIPVKPFLDACTCLVPIFDKLNATAFAPVKMDFQGNIRKVKTKYSLHPEEFTTLQSIILHEIGAKQQFLPNSASMALLWMKRSLEFIVGFLEQIKNGEEDLSVAASTAYSTSLKPYHSWVVRGVFAVAVKALPYKKVFISHLNPSKEPVDSTIFQQSLDQDVESYIIAMATVIQLLNEFIDLNNLNSEEQV